MNFKQLNELKQKAMLNMTAKLDKQAVKKEIAVCTNVACETNGGGKVLQTFKDEIKKQKLEDKVSVGQVGCLGLCALGPIVVVYPEKTFYCKVTTEGAKKIIENHIKKGKVVEEFLYDKADATQSEIDKINFYKKQVFVARKNAGLIDPHSILEYIAFDGYMGLYKALATMTPQGVIEEIKTAGLRGRGGSGSKTYEKWEIVAKQKSDQKYVICNADEGDPGAFMDRSIIDSDPHVLVEALAIAGYAVGANHGIIYIRAEYETAIKSMKKAIEDARDYGLLGDNIFETDFSFDIDVKISAGAFIYGGDTALIESCEGNRAEPSEKSTQLAESGYLDKPTLINNVETLANVPRIIFHGAKWYAKFGTEESKGTKVIALSGKVKNTGLAEVPMGATIKDIVYDVGGGILNDKKFKAVHVGGPSGGCIPAEFMDTQIDYESLKDIGSIMGGGGMIVMDEDTCMVDMARYFLAFSVDESCGKCTPCRIGNKRLCEILTKICNGNGEMKDLDELEDLSHYIKDNSLCGLGQSSPNPVLSSLKYYRDEYIEHIKNKRCPANVCRALKHYEINSNKCIGCSACSINCPVKAISGEIRKPFKIDQTKCIKCNKCYETCKFNAVERGGQCK